MSWGPLLVNLAVTAGTVAALMLATFAYAMRTRVHAIMDTIWPLGFVTVAAVSFGLSAGPGLAARRVMWFVSLPLQVAMYERAGLSAVTWLGMAVWAVGFGFEAVGDAQAHRQEAPGEAHGALQGHGLRRLRPPHQRLHPLAAEVPGPALTRQGVVGATMAGVRLQRPVRGRWGDGGCRRSGPRAR
ncbi:MAG: DUF1295 domain-containing protein [Streptosporangiaceae bacterium]